MVHGAEREVKREGEPMAADRHESIAREGQAFAQQFLPPTMYEAFTAELIQLDAAKYPLPGGS